MLLAVVVAGMSGINVTDGQLVDWHRRPAVRKRGPPARAASSLTGESAGLAGREDMSVGVRGIHCVGAWRDGGARDKSTAPIRATSAPTIRTSEIAMANVSTRSSRRSFASALARCCDTLESSGPGGGIPFVLKCNALSQKRPTSVVHRVGDRSKPRDCSTSGISVASAAPRGRPPKRVSQRHYTTFVCTASAYRDARDTIVVPALYACIVAAALHLNGKGGQSCRQGPPSRITILVQSQRRKQNRSIRIPRYRVQ
jgi:hypothetical protein